MLALVGEGDKREAVVPLPDGRTIPVTMTGEGSGNQGPVNVNITINAMDGTSVRRVLAEEAGTIRNIVAEGVSRRSDFRTTIRGT